MKQLPNGWRHVKLNDEELFRFENGLWTGKKLPLIECAVLRNTNFTDRGDLDLSNVAFIEIEARQLDRKRLEHGDIIIERSGGGPSQPVGRVAYFDASGDFCFSNFTTRLRVIDESVEPNFLHLKLFHFHLSGATEMLQQRTTGIRNLDFNNYKKVDHSLPPIPEQRQIVAALHAIQNARDERTAETQLERERRAALMAYLFSHGTRGVAAIETPLGKLPRNWETKTLGEISKIERGKFSHRPRNDPAFYGGDIPFIQTGDVTGSRGFIEEFSQTLNERGLSVSRIFPKGTIVITIAANIGYAGILNFDCAFPDSLIAITCGDKIENNFLNYYLATQQKTMDEKAPQGTQKNINIEFLNPWPVICPPLDEQREIATILRACDDKIAALEDEATRLEELFRAMLEELMSGRLRVPDAIEQLEHN